MAIDTRVSVRFAGSELTKLESYDVQMSVLRQPARFSVRIGHSGLIAELLKKYPPGTSFELLIGDRPQFLGWTTGRTAGGFAATATFDGHDTLQRLFGSHARATKTFAGVTYSQLVEAVFAANGLPVTVVDRTSSLIETTGSRNARGSEKIKADATKRFKKTIVHPPTIQAGELWWDFLRDHLERQGLFLFAHPSEALQVVLTAADPLQAPLYEIRNGRHIDTSKPGNAKDFQFREDASERFTEAIVYGRGGGAELGRSLATHQVLDAEMRGYGFDRPYVRRDVRVSSIDEAIFLADRAICESRRRGWSLEYTLAGHMTVGIGGEENVVWSRDTTALVIDEELDIRDEFYLESVRYLGDADKTETVVSLMRKGDMLFGSLEDEGG